MSGNWVDGRKLSLVLSEPKKTKILQQNWFLIKVL